MPDSFSDTSFGFLPGHSAVRVTVYLNRLRDNFQELARVCRAPVMPVLKSDAYGHGAVACAKILEPLAPVIGIGTVEEGVHLRKMGITKPVLAMMGLVRAEDAALAVRFGLTPLAGELDALKRLESAASEQGKTASVAWKFDTGMRRLGFALEDVPALAEILDGSTIEPVFALSHLAVADEKDGGTFTDAQARLFSRMMESARACWPEMRCSLANSAAALAYPHTSHSFVRAGLALYGYDPLAESGMAYSPPRLRPVMEAGAPVLQVRLLRAGDTVSYGRTFRAEKTMRIAVVGAGYANGLLRSLSGRGWAVARDRRVPILGRVCMQLCMVDVSELPAVRPGEMVFFLKDGSCSLGADDLGQAAGTIPYELLCLLGSLNRRSYRMSEKGACDGRKKA